MIGDVTIAKKVYIVCGSTNMCNGIDGLVKIVSKSYKLDPREPSLFAFCNRKQDRVKVLLWEGDGFTVIYKRLETHVLRWPQSEDQAKQITPKQFDLLMSGKELKRASLTISKTPMI